MEAIFEAVFQVVAHFLGVSILATLRWIRQGFHGSLRDEWMRTADDFGDADTWVDVVGLVVLFALVFSAVGAIWVVASCMRASV